jgi:asparagine synthase (glutamine-hydrolysing)
MCGVAGICKFKSAVTAEDVSAVQRMMNAQIHRGPDGEGLHHDGRVVFGHRRLSIIDLSPVGKQPMSNEDGTVWVTYNGEIYNFHKLRDELINHGHRFRSKTDTEVLVHGYEEWGIEGLLSQLRGMFAFALYDGRVSAAACLILARDRFGIKPLYYHQNRNQVVFGSEVRAIKKSGLVPDEKNVEALIRFLQLGSVPAPLTTVKDVLALPAGHYLVVNEHGGVSLKQYWDLATYLRSPISNLRSPVETTRSILEDSVRHHLISDVPLGVFLSGGIDSSALVALASRFRDKPLTTLSIVFEEQDYSEAQYARLVAKKYGTDHREVLLRSKDFFDELPRIFAAIDQPTVDGVNTYFVSKAAKEAGLTVVLSGAGGDEVFLGYDHFRKAGSLDGSRRLFGKLPVEIRKGLVKAAMLVGNLTGRGGLEKLTYLNEPSVENAYLLSRGLFAPCQIQDLLGISERDFRSFESTNQYPIFQSLLDSFVLFEFSHYLQNQLLKDTDFMSMAHSIETRVPFLDHRLVEYITGVPTELKLDNGMNKPILVKALGDDLPREIWDRPKMGFTFPFGEWVRKQADDLEARSLEQKGLDSNATKNVWKRFRGGRVHWSHPWALVVASESSGS